MIRDIPSAGIILVVICGLILAIFWYADEQQKARDQQQQIQSEEIQRGEAVRMWKMQEQSR